MRTGKRFRGGAFCIGLASLAGVGALMLSAGLRPRFLPTAGELESSDLIVHEWGTFLGMNGSDGASLDGMYHEEHALPAFVHSRSRDQLRLPFVLTKGETPVIYFYTKVRQQVRVGVGFPRGVWTQWYPQAILVNPPLAQNAEAPDHLSGGRICWQAEVIPSSAVDPAAQGSRRPAATPCGTMRARSMRRTSRQATAPGTRQRPSSSDSCSTAAWARLVCPCDWMRGRMER